jgi:acetoacetyl-CoA synthetase
MAVEVFEDEKIISGRATKGELVCVKPFVSQPWGFWGDEKKYEETYFRSVDGRKIWFHGDFISMDPTDGSFVVYGRSDATLKPGGVRIGTSEIYRALETLEELKDAVCVAVKDQVWLFVVFKDEHVEISQDERNKIRSTIRTACTRHHVPAVVEGVRAVPRTRNGKLAELTVKDFLEGREIKNLNALANPESIDGFSAYRKL